MCTKLFSAQLPNILQRVQALAVNNQPLKEDKNNVGLVKVYCQQTYIKFMEIINQNKEMKWNKSFIDYYDTSSVANLVSNIRK